MMFKEKVAEGHFVESTQGLWATTPMTIPFGIVPVNGTVQKPKEAEMLKKTTRKSVQGKCKRHMGWLEPT